MASKQPTQVLETQLKNSEIAEQSLQWDSETSLNDFVRAIDMLDKISDGLPDDPITANALIGIHNNLSKIYAEFKDNLLAY